MRLALAVSFENPAVAPITHNSESGLAFDECLERAAAIMEARLATDPVAEGSVIRSIMIYCMPDEDEEDEV